MVDGRVICDRCGERPTAGTSLLRIEAGPLRTLRGDGRLDLCADCAAAFRSWLGAGTGPPGGSGGPEAERDRLIDALVFSTDRAEDHEDGDPVGWRATLALPCDPEFEDFATREEAVARVRGYYGLDGPPGVAP